MSPAAELRLGGIRTHFGPVDYYQYKLHVCVPISGMERKRATNVVLESGEIESRFYGKCSVAPL